MSHSQITKKALANAMKDLMAKMPMEKIKISDIVEYCNMNRQSFYYHFKDKYDLVNWIFYTEFVLDIQNKVDEPKWDLLLIICQFFYNDRAFYSNALRIRGQNSLFEYIHEVFLPIFFYGLEEYFQDETTQEFCATFYTDAICHTITRWLLEGTKMPPKKLVGLIKASVEGVSMIFNQQHHIT